MLSALERLSIPAKMLQAIASLYQGPKFRVRHGEETSECKVQQAGIRQGCPLSPLFFALGLAATLEAMDRDIRALDARARVFAYLDDIVVMVPRDLAGEVLPLATAAFGEGLPRAPGPGLAFAQDKTEAWCLAGGGRTAGVPAEARWRTSGFVILGWALEDGSHPDALSEQGATRWLRISRMRLSLPAGSWRTSFRCGASVRRLAKRRVNQS